MVFQLVRNPDAFMDRKVGQPNLRWEILVVLLLGGLGVAGNGYVAYEISSAMEGVETITFPLIGYAIEPLVTLFVVWIAYSLAVHFISNKFYHARGAIIRVFKLTAWALIPLGVAYALRSAILFYIVQGMDMNQVAEDADAIGFQGVVPSIVGQVESDPLFVAAPIVMAIAVAATGYLMVYVVRNTKGLETDEARRVAGFIAGVHLLYLAWVTVNTV